MHSASIGKRDLRSASIRLDCRMMDNPTATGKSNGQTAPSRVACRAFASVFLEIAACPERFAPQ